MEERNGWPAGALVTLHVWTARRNYVDLARWTGRLGAVRAAPAARRRADGGRVPGGVGGRHRGAVRARDRAPPARGRRPELAAERAPKRLERRLAVALLDQPPAQATGVALHRAVSPDGHPGAQP